MRCTIFSAEFDLKGSVRKLNETELLLITIKLLLYNFFFHNAQTLKVAL